MIIRKSIDWFGYHAIDYRFSKLAAAVFWAKLAILCLLFAGINLTVCPALSSEQLKVGFIMGGPISDYGWNQAHNEGRLYLERTMQGKVQTIFAEKIPENAEAARIMEKMIAQGAKLIFLTTYGYLDPAIGVASRHPEVIFMQINRLCQKPLKNIGSYHPHFYEPMYVAGIVAGRMTKSNNIGFVIGHPVPNVFVTMNAFTLGARSVNPKICVHAVCLNTWSDPVAEAEATRGLAERSNDIIVSHLDSAFTVCLSAAKSGVYSIGEHIDLNKQVPKSWLTGQCWNYGKLYVNIVQSIIDGSWKPGPQYYGLRDDCIRLSSFGQSVPSSVRTEALTILQKVRDGNFKVFTGPLKDSHGHERLARDKVFDNSELSSMNWAVNGVECGFSAR